MILIQIIDHDSDDKEFNDDKKSKNDKKFKYDEEVTQRLMRRRNTITNIQIER